MSSLDSTTRLRRSPNATYQTVADEAILIHMQTGTYYSLNEVGTVFWDVLDGTKSIADCAVMIAAEYDAPSEMIEGDLIEVAQDLVREGLAEKAP